MKNSFASQVRNSSVRTFSLQLTLTDALSVCLLGVAAALSGFFFGDETHVLWRGLVAFQAALGVCSCYVIVRSLVPMALSLSFADMMRLRTEYYFWVVCLVGLVALGPVTRTMFSSFGAASASLTLTLAALALTVRFLQCGSLLALTLAFAGAGLAVGVSAFGIVAAVLSIAVIKVASLRLLGDGDSPWQDALAPKLVDYFMNPLVRARMNWLLALCFLACAALSFCAVRLDFAPAVAARLRIPWPCGITADGAAFVLATGILPFVVAVGKAHRASDTSERLGIGMTLLYVTIAAFSAVMLVNPALLLLLSGIPLRVEAGLTVLTSVLYAYNLLLSAMCLLIDVRCRDYRNVNAARAVTATAASLRGVVQVVSVLACLAPLALVALVAANLLFDR